MTQFGTIVQTSQAAMKCRKDWSPDNKIAHEQALLYTVPDFDTGSYPRRRESVDPTVTIVYSMHYDAVKNQCSIKKCTIM